MEESGARLFSTLSMKPRFGPLDHHTGFTVFLPQSTVQLCGYSLELRRIMAFTQRYSLCWSFNSRNLDVVARSMSKISRIPSTHFPSSLQEFIWALKERRALDSHQETTS